LFPSVRLTIARGGFHGVSYVFSVQVFKRCFQAISGDSVSTAFSFFISRVPMVCFHFSLLFAGRFFWDFIRRSQQCTEKTSGTSTITGEFGFLGFLLAFLLLVFFFFLSFFSVFYLYLFVFLLCEFLWNFFFSFFSQLSLVFGGQAGEGKVDFVT